MYKHVILSFLVFTALLPAHAQVSRSDLDDIERHRQPPRTVNVLQSIDEPMDSTRWDFGRIGTWDFLDEEDEEVDENGYGHIDIKTLKGRLAALPQELIVPYHEGLEDQIENYVIRHARSLRGIIGKYRYYAPSFRAAFSRHGLPEDLTALAIVESAMNPLATSKAGARGVWQFMPETARRYGLRCDPMVDERLDPYRSADAAARYLKASYKKLGSWPLAVASYNCGLASVETAIALAGTTDFWSVYQYLPAETKGYMPAFVAALYSLSFYEQHGIKPTAYSEGAVATFKITRKMTFKEIIRATGVELQDIYKLNPQYTGGTIPGNDKEYILRLPKKYSKLFIDNIDVVDAG